MTERPIRLCSVATAPADVAVLEALGRIAPDQVEHVLTLGDPDMDRLARDFTPMRPGRGQPGGGHFAGSAQALETGPAMAPAQLEAIDALTRGPDRDAFNHHGVQDLQDYQHITHIAYDVLGRMLQEERITHVLFFDSPGSFYETCLTHAARALGLEVLILRRGIFPDQLVSMRNEQDLGHLATRPEDTDAASVPVPDNRIDATDGQVLVDVQDTPGRSRLRDIGQMITYLLARDPLKLLNPVGMARILRRMRQIPGQAATWRDPYFKFFHTGPLAYFDYLTGGATPLVDRHQPFVYFRMPCQPAMTDGRYRDPLLAVERLAEILPEGHMIYVEDPQRRNGNVRSSLSFHRLNRIKQVRVVPNGANSHDMLAQAVAAADVAGSLGWGAICAGKPVLCFGSAWWADAPGVTRYRPGLSFDDVLSNPPDQGALERFAGVIQARSHSVQPGAEQVARLVLDLFAGHVPHSFDPMETCP